MEDRKTVWLLFVTSVWMLIALSAYRMIIHIERAGDILAGYPGGYAVRVLIAPFFLLGFELFLWFWTFQRARPPARIFAGIVGAYILLMIVLVNALAAEVYDRAVPVAMLGLHTLVGIGHLAFAFFGRERSF